MKELRRLAADGDPDAMATAKKLSESIKQQMDGINSGVTELLRKAKTEVDIAKPPPYMVEEIDMEAFAREREEKEAAALEREVQTLELTAQIAASQARLVEEQEAQGIAAAQAEAKQQKDSDRHYNIQIILLIFTVISILIATGSLVFGALALSK